MSNTNLSNLYSKEKVLSKSRDDIVLNYRHACLEEDVELSLTYLNYIGYRRELKVLNYMLGAEIEYQNEQKSDEQLKKDSKCYSFKASNDSPPNILSDMQGLNYAQEKKEECLLQN